MKRLNVPVAKKSGILTHPPSLCKIWSMCLVPMKTLSRHSKQTKSGSNDVRVVVGKFETCGLASIFNALKDTYVPTQEYTNSLGSHSSDHQDHPSFSVASKMFAHHFQTTVSVQCPLSIVDHVQRTVLGAAVSWPSFVSESRPTGSARRW